MKAAVFLLVCLPMVLCEEKRFVLGTDCTGKYSGQFCSVASKSTYSFGHLGDLLPRDTIKNDVQMIRNILGFDPTEAACQATCMELLKDGSDFAFGCILLCRGFHTIVKQCGLVPQTKTSGGSP